MSAGLACVLTSRWCKITWLLALLLLKQQHTRALHGCVEKKKEKKKEWKKKRKCNEARCERNVVGSPVDGLALLPVLFPIYLLVPVPLRYLLSTFQACWPSALDMVRSCRLVVYSSTLNCSCPSGIRAIIILSPVLASTLLQEFYSIAGASLWFFSFFSFFSSSLRYVLERYLST